MGLFGCNLCHTRCFKLIRIQKSNHIDISVDPNSIWSPAVWFHTKTYYTNTRKHPLLLLKTTGNRKKRVETEDLELPSKRSPRCWACFLTCVRIKADSYFDSRRIPHNLEIPQSQHEIQKSSETQQKSLTPETNQKPTVLRAPGNLHCSASRTPGLTKFFITAVGFWPRG